VLDRLVRQAYLRLGRRYGVAYVLAQGPSSLAIATIALVLLTSYYDPSAGEVVLMLAVTWASTLAAIAFALWRGRPYLSRALAWQSRAAPGAEESIAAWDAATNYPMRSFRANVVAVGTIAAVPAIACITVVLDLGPVDVLVVLVATLLPVGYATVFNYFVTELLTRPLVEDIAATLPEDFPFATTGLLIRKRLKILLPIFTGFVGLVVAGLMTGDGGTRTLALSVVAAAGVGLLFSFELSVLLSRSVTAPIAALRVGLGRVRAGDYDARVPVVTSDELGELSHDFNLMAAGLAEREELRETFGTYLDRDVVRLILSGRFPREGVEVVVSIMFVDVRGFTSFAERSDATEVVAALNELFEVMVPIVAEHGGHVDKFLGDGLLAVFGAPEGYRDHADRAVAAGLALARAVNRPGAELRIGVGINTGPVVAGSIGGAGRLNFSVIGDAVNLAARVEAATRDTGDDLLITRATRDALTLPGAAVSRGSVALKGKEEPVEVLACPVSEEEAQVLATSPADAGARGPAERT
jgi:adenylate cyclase